jgi:hypothetical protein
MTPDGRRWLVIDDEAVTLGDVRGCRPLALLAVVLSIALVAAGVIYRAATARARTDRERAISAVLAVSHGRFVDANCARTGERPNTCVVTVQQSYSATKCVKWVVVFAKGRPLQPQPTAPRSCGQSALLKI